MTNRWFDYGFRVQPHHTDYSGVVWHGTYIQWLESARVECLRHLGFAFEDFVQAGYDLPVVDLHLRYHRPLTLGAKGVVRTRLEIAHRVRLTWVYEIYGATPTDTSKPCMTGQVQLVPIDISQRKIVRRLPIELEPMFTSLRQYFAS